MLHGITGHTRVFGIVADPIHHVRTPSVLNATMRERGVDGVLVPFHVPPEALATVLAAFRALPNFGGFIATVPHKIAVCALCDGLTQAARVVGAANAVRRETDGRLIGDILDGRGFVAGLRAAGLCPRGQVAFVAGAGGAASAIAFALAEAGVARLTLHNRTAHRLDALVRRLAAAFPDLPIQTGGPDPDGHDLVVNATSLGLRDGDPPPFDLTRLVPTMTVAEVIMEPERTQLLRAAEARGCRVQPGLPMLHEQSALMADFLGMVA